MTTTIVASLTTGALVAGALLTWLVIAHLRRLQRIVTQPRLVLDIEADGDGTPSVTVTNVGNGPALDAALLVTFERHDSVRQAGERPPRLPQRFHTERVLGPGGRVRFLPPGGPDTGYLGPDALASWVRAIGVTGTATDLRGRRITVHDRLDDPYRRVQTLNAYAGTDRPRAHGPHHTAPGSGAVRRHRTTAR